MASLYRTNAQSGALENAFRRAGIRYRITGGESFYNRPEVLDALACLQAASDPEADDEAMRRFVDLPPHPRTEPRTCAQIDASAGRSFRTRARPGAERCPAATPPTCGCASNWLQRSATQRSTCRSTNWSTKALIRTDYRRAVTASADGDAFDRLDNLAELACDASVFAREHGGDGDTPRSACGCSTPSSSTAARCALRADRRRRRARGPVDAARDEGTRVRHGRDRRLRRRAPGRTVAASADGNAAVEEERRLACIGMTRARTVLYLSVPQVTGHGAKQRETAPSPFLTQIPDKLRTIAAPTAPQGEPPADVTRGPLGPERSL